MVTLTPLTRSFAALLMVGILSGCSTLPRDGPTGRNIERGSSAQSPAGTYAIIDLDYAASERIKAAPAAFLGSLSEGSAQVSGGAIGMGDVLSVSIFEPSGSLFGGSSGSSDPGSRGSSQSLPPLTVDASGTVNVPFGGPVQVAGLTSSQAAAAVRRALIGKVANPQVIVSIASNAFNTVTVLGEIRNPGRAPLSMNSDRVIDVIAERGGTTRAVKDVTVVIQRDGQTYSAPLTAVMSQSNENIRLARGDQVDLVYVPRHFSTFGALGAVALTEMGPGSLSLADALSRVGGLDTNSANARSVLIFRFERPAVADALGVAQPPLPRGVPIVYRLNLEDATGFFTANNFQIEPDDILYVPRSGSAEMSKFFTLVQTFTRVIYDVSVTSTLNNN